MGDEKEIREAWAKECDSDGWPEPQGAFIRGYRAALERQKMPDPERIAQLLAHRACTGMEHDPENGKLHGCCIVCGVPWPCEIASPETD